MSPMTIALPFDVDLKATHDPSASPALICTPLNVTFISLRGSAYLCVPSGWSCPGRPMAASTSFQSVAAGAFVALGVWAQAARDERKKTVKRYLNFAGINKLLSCYLPCFELFNSIQPYRMVASV